MSDIDAGEALPRSISVSYKAPLLVIAGLWLVVFFIAAMQHFRVWAPAYAIIAAISVSVLATHRRLMAGFYPILERGTPVAATVIDKRYAGVKRIPRLEVRVRYTIAGTEFEQWVLTHQYSAVQELISGTITAGSTVTVFVDNDDPSVSVLPEITGITVEGYTDASPKL